MSSERKKYTRATEIEKVEMLDAFRALIASGDLTVHKEDGTCSYNNGWSDAKVAEGLDSGLAENFVQLHRKRIYGNFKRRAKGIAKTTTKAEVKALRASVGDLEAKISAMQVTDVNLGGQIKEVLAMFDHLNSRLNVLEVGGVAEEPSMLTDGRGNLLPVV